MELEGIYSNAGPLHGLANSISITLDRIGYRGNETYISMRSALMSDSSSKSSIAIVNAAIMGGSNLKNTGTGHAGFEVPDVTESAGGGSSGGVGIMHICNPRWGSYCKT